ncbi:MAG: uL15 family ribosomal protein [Nitrososphaeria archaeon]
MPTRLRKSRAKRGTRVVGWGRVGQHRKAGSRGGRGGSGLKRHKKSWMLRYDPDHFGRHGFHRHPAPNVVRRWINVGDLDELYPVSRAEGGALTVDLASLGIGKLLGGGSVRGAYNVTVGEASAEAVRKIKEAGGRVVLLSQAAES